MKHLPNLLTLGNLFCGCLSIAYTLTAQPFVYRDVAHGSLDWIMGTEQLYYGSIFLGLAAIFDMLDGATARALGIFSPIGKDLDSLADIVSFGVAPSMIMFKLLWDALAGEHNALDINMLALAPAFLIACFAALRLAKYNITSSEQKSWFVGMPTPAVGIFIGSFPMLIWYNPMEIQQYMHYKWVLYLIIGLCCWFMVSNFKFIKFVPTKFKMPYMWPQLVIVVASLVSIPFIQIACIPLAFVLYVLLSFVFKHPDLKNIETTA